MKNLCIGIAFLLVLCVCVAGIVAMKFSAKDGGAKTAFQTEEAAEEQGTVNAEQQAKVASLELELAKTREKLKELESRLPAAAPVPLGAQPAEETPEEPGESEEAAPDKAKKNPMAAMAQMFAGEKGKKMAVASAKMQVGMMYDEFLGQIDESMRGPLRDVIVNHMAEMMTSMAEVAADGFDGEKMKTFQQENENNLRDAVAELLTPQELETWDAYTEELPGRMIQRQFETQLSMSAPSLNEEQRSTVASVIAEEMISGQGVPESMDPTDMSGAMAVQREAFASAQERLLDYLTPEQQEELGRVLAQQLETMEAFSGAMSGDE